MSPHCSHNVNQMPVNGIARKATHPLIARSEATTMQAMPFSRCYPHCLFALLLIMPWMDDKWFFKAISKSAE